MGKHIQLKDWDLPVAGKAAEEVDALMKHPGFPYFMEAVRLYEESVHRQLLTNPKESAAEYADVVGQLKGLRLIREIPEHILEHARYLEDKDRDEEAVADDR